jgi:hypothetical protein
MEIPQGVSTLVASSSGANVDRSVLCLKLYEAMSKVDRETAFGKRALNLWECLQNQELEQPGQRRRPHPHLNVVSGLDPNLQRTQRLDPLWFELCPETVHENGSRSETNGLIDSQTKKATTKERPRIPLADFTKGFGTK